MSKCKPRLNRKAEVECADLFSIILDIAHDAIIVIDQSQIIVLFNQGAQRIFGYSAAEVIGQPLDILLPPAVIEIHQGHIRGFAQSAFPAQAMYERRIVSGRRKDGVIFPAEASIAKASVGGEMIFTVILHDITDRKAVEESLHEKERLLSEAENIARMGSWEYDVVADQLRFSEEIYRLLGITPETFSHQPKNFPSLIHPQDYPAADQWFKALLAGKKPDALELRIISPDGRIRNVHSRGEAYFDSQGTPLRIIGIAQDITEWKRAEQEIHYQANLLANVSDAIIATDLQFHVQYWNAAAEALYGWKADEVYGKLLSELIQNEFLNISREEATRQAQEQGGWKGEVFQTRRDGSKMLVLASVSLVLDAQGTAIGFVATNRDITERKRTEEELRQSEQRFQLAMEAANMGTWEVDLASRRVRWSDEYGFLYGLTPDQHPPDERAYFKLVHPDDRDLVGRRFGNAIEKDTLYECEFRVIWPDGSGLSAHGASGPVHWHSAVGRPIKDSQGIPLRMIGVGMDVTERKRVEDRMATQLRRMESLHAIDMAIANSHDVRLALRVLVEAAVSHLGVDAADILLYKTSSSRLEFAAGQGFRNKDVGKRHLQLGKGFAGRIALEQQSIHIPDLKEVGDEFIHAPLFIGEDFITYFGVPLVAKGQIKGVLEIYHRAHLNPDEDWMNFLETLAEQAAIAIDNAQLFENFQRSNIHLSLAYDATIEGWSRAMDLRDRETEGHTQRVTELTVQLAQAIGIPEEEITHIRRGALLHDMGKLGVRDAILLKPDKLTDEEWAIMRRHPQFAYDMLTSIEYLRPALDIPYCHHEKWDGTGYPRGLKGEQIPLAARLFAVVDVWDALRFDRPYRKGWPEEEVLEHIRTQSGTHFDPKVVDLFLRVLSEKTDTLYQEDR